MQFFEGDENFSWRVLGIESFVIMLSVLLGFTLSLIEKLTTGYIMGELTTIKDWQMVFALMANNGGFAYENYPELLKLLSERYDVAAAEAASPDSARAER